MSKQNIYDNEIFFDGYKKLRENESNANDLFEIPALFSLMPPLNGKSILDLGCGFGEHCKKFILSGADKVVGIDISEKMLDVARKENSDQKITYINMAIEDIEQLDGNFDVVVSSLALHYVEDFSGVVSKVYNLLTEDGIFIFSQEHPINTSYSGGNRWTKDENGKKLYLNLSDYGVEGERESTWFIDNVKKYHRMFSTVINNLTDADFIIEKLIEPLPTDDMLAAYPEHADLFHKPDFLLVKCRKN